MEISNYYDIILVSFSLPQFDARTINLFNSLQNKGKKCLLIALTSEKECYFDKQNCTLFIPQSSKKRSYQRWIDFNKRAWELVKHIQCNIAVGCDLYGLYIARKISIVNNAKLIYDSREVYSQLGPLSESRIKQAILSFIEKYMVKRVDQLIVSGRLDGEYLVKHFSNQKKYSIILNLPNKIDLNRNDLIRQKLNLPINTKIAIYQGRLLKGRGIEKSILAIKNIDNVALCIFGGGELGQEIESIITSNKLADRVFLMGEIDYNELLEWTKSADIGLSLFENISLSYKYALPNKLFEYVMAEVPCIFTSLPAMMEVYKEYKIGIPLYEEFTPSDLANAIANILTPEIYSDIQSEQAKARNVYNYMDYNDNVIEKLFNN